nr:zinc knuckle CX2CX4HX4C [Tanacetum cinerariifolium]
STSFWNDLWIGDTRLCHKFPRLFALDVNKYGTDSNLVQSLKRVSGFRVRLLFLGFRFVLLCVSIAMDVSKLNSITGYASNRIPATIDDVARMFDVSLNTIQELDGFAMQFQSNDLGLDNTDVNRVKIDTPIVQSVDVEGQDNTYAGAAGASVNISIPRKVVQKVNSGYLNTLYGYFIGKRMAFPVVEYYAKTNWAKHGLKRIMMNAKGFFFFQFDTSQGLEAVLECGPWMFGNSPIILKKWTVKTSLLKEELTRIPVWIKFHDIPLQVFKEEGVSLITSYLGKPIMMDSITSSMCKDAWGRSSF